MASIQRRLVEVSLATCFVISLLLHSGGSAMMYVASAFLEKERDRSTPHVIEISMVRAAPPGAAEAPASVAPTPVEPAAAAAAAPEEAPPVEPEPQPTPPEAEVVPTPPEADPAVEADPPPEATPPPPAEEEPDPGLRAAPYEEAPAAPAQPALQAGAQNDESPDEAIREELPVPTYADVTSSLETPEERDFAPQLDTSSDRPSTDNTREAPELEEFENLDTTPERSQPDTAREGGEEVDAPPEAEVAEDETTAPETAPRPRRRPVRAEQEPEAPSGEDDPLAGLESAVSGVSSEAGAAPFDPTAGGGPLTAGEIGSMRGMLNRCYRRPPPGADVAEWVVVLQIEVRRDGRLAGEPVVVSPAEPWTTTQRNAVAAALAGARCADFNVLPIEKYEQWRDLTITFDPARDAPTLN